MAIDGTFFGFGAGAPDEIARGKRRTVTYWAFVLFVLIAAACDAPDWVTGGLEFDVGGPNGVPVQSLSRSLTYLCDAGGYPISDLMERTSPMLGVTVQPKFHIGLTQWTQGGTWLMRYSQVAVDRECTLNIADQIADINAQVNLNWTFWYGSKPFNVQTFNSTFGLLVFAAVLQFFLWLAFVAISYDAPVIATHKLTMPVIRYGSVVGTLLFTIIPLAVFGSSGVKTAFCAAFDPDTRFNGTFCGYQTGFNLAVTCVVFALFQAAALWFWLPKDVVVGNRYEFSSKGGYESVGAPTDAAPDASAPMSSGSYQDFGGSTGAA